MRKGKTALLTAIDVGFAAISKEDYQAIDNRWMGASLPSSPHLRYAYYAVGAITSLVLLLSAWLWTLRRGVARKTRELSESEERHRSILRTAMNGIWLVDNHGHFKEVNIAYCRMSGYSEQELLSMRIHDLDADESTEDTVNRMNMIKERGEAHFESRHRRKDGNVFDVEVNAQHLPTEGGQYLAFIQDITERKRYEELITHSNKLLQTIIDTAPVRIFWKDTELRYLGCNTLFAQDAGVDSPDELCGRDDHQLAWKDQAEQYRADDRLVMESGIPKLSYDEQQTTPTGETMWLRTSKVPLRDEEDNVIAVLGMYEDITERKQMELALIQSEQNLRTMIKVSPEPLAVNDSQGNVTFLNDAFMQTVGYSLDEIPTLEEWWHRAYPDPRYRQTIADNWKKNLEEAKRTNSPFAPMEVSIVCKDGTVRSFICSAASIESGFEGSHLVVLFDITERKESEERAKESHSRALSILNGLDSIVYVADMETYELLFINDFLKSHFGDIIGHTCWKSIQSGQPGPCAFCSNDKLLDAGGNPTGIYQWEFQNTVNGHWYDVRDRAIKWIDGRTVRLEIATDITDRKRSDEEKHNFELQMQHTQKLESLGVLSGGIAHDFNNILAIIMGYCSLTKLDYETVENNITEIEKAAERAAALCRQMLAYAGKAHINQTQVNVGTMVDEMITMLKSALPQNTVIKPELSVDIPSIDADASQLRQVVMNLIINASEAIGSEQGEIKVALTRSTLTAGHQENDYQGKAIPPGSYICFEVTDNGSGMDEETKWRIFEPFYTTKFTGRGLGMSAVLGIINSHGGVLQLFSQLGIGTTFKVYLPIPISDTGEEEEQNHPTPSIPWKGSGIILLVEDEDQIRFLAKSLLELFGFTVLEAVNGREALELYRKNAADIKLVFTDMGMPVMDGYVLFSALKQLDPTLPIIISSGFGEVDVTSRIDRDTIAGIINKPYNPNQLREALRIALEGK